MSNVSFGGSSTASYLPGIMNTYSQSTTKNSDTQKNSSVKDTAKSDDTNKNSSAGKTDSTTKSSVTGKTIGNAKLSEKAQAYYEELKKKYSNLDFILVSEDQKEYAKSQAASYANANNMVVLIDEDKIERMAEDENYRAQYESIIASAASGLSQLGTSIAATGASVKGYGMQVNDNGTASYFAVLEKSSEAQRERIEKKAEEKKEAKKAEEKKAEKEEREERIKGRDKFGEPIHDKYDEPIESEDSVTIIASTMEELLQKISDYQQMYLSDTVQTEEEKMVGQNVDFFA